MTNEDRKYNGWTNYETWAVKLWMDNDPGDADFWSEHARAAYEEAEADGTFSKAERAALDLMDQLKEYHEDLQPEVTGVFADLLNAAMSEVNWHEIAVNLIESEEPSLA